MKNKETISPERYAQILQGIIRNTSFVKTVCGVGNNAAWCVVLEAMGHVRRSPRYGASVKGGGRVCVYFRKAIQSWHTYADHLVNAKVNRMFHLDDMEPDVRRAYGDITDQKYYDFWSSVGGIAYSSTHGFVTSLQNKYRLALLHAGDAEPETSAWVITASAALHIANVIYDSAIVNIHRDAHLPLGPLQEVFGQFRLSDTELKWDRAVKVFTPSFDIEASELDARNIELGRRQLLEAWTDPDIIYNSTAESVRDREEVFATRGFQKKAIMSITERHSATLNELKSDANGKRIEQQ